MPHQTHRVLQVPLEQQEQMEQQVPLEQQEQMEQQVPLAHFLVICRPISTGKVTQYPMWPLFLPQAILLPALISQHKTLWATARP
jgi:hypothetical protein